MPPHRMTMTFVETPVAQIQLLEQGASAPKSLQGRRRKDERVKRLRLPGLYVTEARLNSQQSAHANMMG